MGKALGACSSSISPSPPYSMFSITGPAIFLPAFIFVVTPGLSRPPSQVFFCASMMAAGIACPLHTARICRLRQTASTRDDPLRHNERVYELGGSAVYVQYACRQREETVIAQSIASASHHHHARRVASWMWSTTSSMSLSTLGCPGESPVNANDNRELTRPGSIDATRRE
ncbi:hypothetical protein BD626DRAFT_495457 [Schizophyllum amplum]|uniref:Uncharacterized protein n=1 Tax=Schizophyllum amplum TaxID=97359 RepID=A0A550CE60_9AGAR|nr:hypothetical protein BD626DRAFT_495457 [Auriculariopsis ampla]